MRKKRSRQSCAGNTLTVSKKNLRSQLDNIDIVNKDGSVENLGKKFDAGKNGN